MRTLDEILMDPGPLDADEEHQAAEYIAAKCQEIQATWTATERRRRLVMDNPPAELPTARQTDLTGTN